MQNVLLTVFDSYSEVELERLKDYGIIAYYAYRDYKLLKDYQQLLLTGMRKKQIRQLLAKKFLISDKTVEVIIYKRWKKNAWFDFSKNDKKNTIKKRNRILPEL